MSNKLTDQQKVERYLAKIEESFPFFLKQLWKSVYLPEPPPIQLDIGAFLSDGPRRRVIKGWRGVSKTWVTIAYCLWRLMREPNERILLVSQSRDHSRKSLLLMRQWINMVPFLNKLQPRKNSKQRDSTDMFDVGPARWDRSASVSAMGVTGMLTGGRASIIVADDVETLENSMTKLQREKIAERVTEFEAILLPGGDIVYLGTPHHVDESLYDELPELGYTIRSWPARIPTGPQREKIPGLAPIYDQMLDNGLRIGDPVWPERFSDEDLHERERAQRTRFATQFMLMSGMADELRFPLRLADLMVMPVGRDMAPSSVSWGMRDHNGSTIIEEISSPGLGKDAFYRPAMIAEQWRKYHGTKAFLDPAGTGKDEMAWTIGANLHGYIWVKAAGACTGGGTPDNLDQIAIDMIRHRVDTLVIESQFGGSYLAELIKPVIVRMAKEQARLHNEKAPSHEHIKPWSVTVECERAVGRKEDRIIDNTEPALNQHRVIVDEKVARNTELMYQLSHMTREKDCLERDDRIDSFAGLIKLWADMLSIDPDNAAKRRVDKEYLAAIRSRRPWAVKPQPRWFSH